MKSLTYEVQIHNENHPQWGLLTTTNLTTGACHCKHTTSFTEQKKAVILAQPQQGHSFENTGCFMTDAVISPSVSSGSLLERSFAFLVRWDSGFVLLFLTVLWAARFQTCDHRGI